MGLIDALKNSNGEYNGKKAKNVNINLGTGDAQISVRGDNVNIKTGTGNQAVEVLGNDVDIELDKNASLDWDSSHDQDFVLTTADSGKQGKVKINTGDGNDLAYAIAKDVEINMGKGDHVVGFWADNKANITVGNGNNDITTMDKLISRGDLDEDTTLLNINYGKYAEDALEASTLKSSETLYDLTSAKMDKQSFLNKIQKTYNLDKVNMTVLEQLYDSGELQKELKPGVPLYSVMESVTQKNPDGSSKYIICKNDWTVGQEGIHSRGLIAGSSSRGQFNVNGRVYGFDECVATKQYTQSSYTEQNQIIHEVATRDIYEFNGAKEVNIKTGSGNRNYINITSTGDVDINSKNFKNHYVTVDSGRVYGDINIEREVETVRGRTFNFGTNIANTYTSPIVVDFNKDGKVSAKSGDGVDVDGNGVGDGYASDGDKMLAMSDKNKSGAIDGSEVFGDQTVSPFTGQKLNAANGFEALKMIAQEAEQYTGIKCLNNGEVNLQNLKAALSTVGVDLGFISGSNVTELEDLAHVASINVDEYDEVDANGDVQHRQQGTYTSSDGETYGANDVWFKNRTNIDKMKDRLK